VILRSVDAVATLVGGLAPRPGRRILGITGPPGTGKSTVAAALAQRLPRTVVLPMDGYHLPQARLRELGRRERMGAPDTFDVAGFLRTMDELRISGGPVFAPDFDRAIEEPLPDAIVIQPEVDVIVEGNYLLLDSGGWERVAPLLDVTFFVETPDDIRLARLIERHERFGKSPEAARAWANGPDEDNARLIAGTAPRADHVIALS
jgi:pantothenate kinase